MEWRYLNKEQISMKGVTEEQSAFSDIGTSLPFLFLSVTLTLVVLFGKKKQLCNTLNRLQTTNTFSLISTASITQVMKNPV